MSRDPLPSEGRIHYAGKSRKQATTVHPHREHQSTELHPQAAWRSHLQFSGTPAKTVGIPGPTDTSKLQTHRNLESGAGKQSTTRTSYRHALRRDTAGCQGPSETEGLGPSIVGMGVEGV